MKCYQNTENILSDAAKLAERITVLRLSKATGPPHSSVVFQAACPRHSFSFF